MIRKTLSLNKNQQRRLSNIAQAALLTAATPFPGLQVKSSAIRFQWTSIQPVSLLPFL